MESNKLTALKKLSQNIPVANSRVAQQQQAARDIQLQQAVGQAPVAAPTTKTAQAVGGNMAQEAGNQQNQRAQQMIQGQQQVAQLGAQQQQQDTTQTLQGLQQGADEQRLAAVQKFANLSEQAKQEMFDSRLQFKQDEQGRALFNERQLADYAKLTAKSDVDYQNYAREASQAHDMNIQALESINARLELAMKSDFARKQEGLDQMTDRQIYEQKKKIDEKIAKAKAKKANSQAAWQAGGTIVGGAAGAVFGGPAGAVAGAAVGGAVGGVVGSQVS